MLQRIMIIFLVLMGLISSSCSKSENPNEKVLSVSVQAKIKGLDPVNADDSYSHAEVSRVYEGLLEYHYLKRPYTLEPNLAESMPTISDDGLTYTFNIKKGVLFQDDKCFPQGKGRELVAKDFVYSLKRLADPKIQARGWWVLEGKIKGLNEWREKYSQKDQVDYHDEVEGLKALDQYTLQFKLSKPFPQFLYALAMSYTMVVPREAVEYYKQEFLNHPVGTGAFVLTEFRPSSGLTYVKNPNFRDKFYPNEGAPEFVEKGFLQDAGKKLPFVDKIKVMILVEDQPRWLNFMKGKIDYVGPPKDNFDSAIGRGNEVSDELKKLGITVQVIPSLDLTYSAFNLNMELFKNKKLRQAMSLAYDTDTSNKLFYNDTAVAAESLIPPTAIGYDPTYKNPFRGPDYEKAKQLLAQAGYPEGKGLPEIVYETTSGATSKQMGDFFSNQMAKIGIKVKVSQNPWPELSNKINNGQAMMWGIAWLGDYPDPETFLQLLYGPNRAGGSNKSGFQDDQYDQLFAKASIMQDSPERTAIYQQINKIGTESVPWILGVHRQIFRVNHSWLKNYIYSDFAAGTSIYHDIDLEKKKEMLKKL